MKKPTVIEDYWRAFLGSASAKTGEISDRYETWHFCDDRDSADKLASLVIAGVKTATSSLVWTYEAENEALPVAGNISIITNWDGDPVCIIETMEVQIHPFNEVSAQTAWDEGEGDRSLEYWRGVHWDYFSRECASLGREPAETMPVINEWFRVLYP